MQKYYEFGFGESQGYVAMPSNKINQAGKRGELKYRGVCSLVMMEFCKKYYGEIFEEYKQKRSGK